MAKHRYEILEERPDDHPLLPAGAEVGSEVELDLSAEQRRAMIAAGWISEPLDADEGTSSSKSSKGGKG